jgi:hypothetical protein
MAKNDYTTKAPKEGSKGAQVLELLKDGRYSRAQSAELVGCTPVRVGEVARGAVWQQHPPQRRQRLCSTTSPTTRP